MTTATAPRRLPWTGDEEADRLIAVDATALLIGFVLDQQVPVPKAFSGPRVLRERLGSLDPAVIAREDPERLAAIFRTPPAIHRFPGSMAARVQALCAAIVESYGGRPERIWEEATDARDLTRRLSRLPGIGEMKVRTLVALLARQYGVRPRGWEAELPSHPTLADCTTPEELAAYQAGKRAHKARLREEAAAAGRTVRTPGRSRPSGGPSGRGGGRRG